MKICAVNAVFAFQFVNMKRELWIKSRIKSLLIKLNVKAVVVAKLPVLPVLLISKKVIWLVKKRC